MGYEAAVAFLTIPLLGVAALVPGGPVAVAAIALDLAVTPIINEIKTFRAWQYYASQALYVPTDVPVKFDPSVSEQHVTPDLPTLAPVQKEKPQIKSLTPRPSSPTACSR